MSLRVLQVLLAVVACGPSKNAPMFVIVTQALEQTPAVNVQHVLCIQESHRDEFEIEPQQRSADVLERKVWACS